MDDETRRKQILKQMAQIDCMEKGRSSEEYREIYRDGEQVRLGPYFKHQRWEDGRNISRRVPVGEAQRLREALLKDGCRILEGLFNQPNALGKHMPQGTCHATRTKRVQTPNG